MSDCLLECARVAFAKSASGNATAFPALLASLFLPQAINACSLLSVHICCSLSQSVSAQLFPCLPNRANPKFHGTPGKLHFRPVQLRRRRQFPVIAVPRPFLRRSNPKRDTEKGHWHRHPPLPGKDPRTHLRRGRRCQSLPH
jgi:hypothetical protein